MSFRTKFILTLLSATLTLYTAVGGWISTRAQQPANDPNAQLRIFESVLQHIQSDYVDDPNMDKVRAGALRGLAYGLDPYSTYLTPDQVKEFNAGNNNSVAGIGAEMSQVASYLYVIAPMKGSPADLAGIKPSIFQFGYCAISIIFAFEKCNHPSLSCTDVGSSRVVIYGHIGS